MVPEPPMGTLTVCLSCWVTQVCLGPVLVVDDPGVLLELTRAALSCLRALAVARKYTHGIRVR